MTRIAFILGVTLSVAVSFLLPKPSFAQPQSLTIALGQEPDNGFDPILGWGQYNNPLFQSSLLTQDDHLEFAPELASQWQLSSDKLTWSVTLKPQLKFSDGTALTAADVKFTFDTAKHSASTHDLTNLAKVVVVSKNKLQFKLNQPDINFIDNFVHLAIVPKAGYSKTYGQHPIGSGPFRFVRWDKGQQLLIEANPYYNGQQPAFKKMTIVFSNEESRYSRLMAGQLQLAALPPRYAKQLPRGFKLWSIESVDNRGIAWPMVKRQGEIGNDVTSQLAIRQAMDAVVDRNLLVNQLLDGHATPAYSIADGLPWGVAAQGEMKGDHITQAQKILDAAGWKLINGVRQRDGVKAEFELYYRAGDSIREQLALTVTQFAQRIGIRITPVGASWEVIEKHMHQQPVVLGFGSLSAMEVRYVHHSQYRGVEFFNTGYYSNSEVDKALDSARIAKTWPESLPYWHQAQRIIAKDLPWTWLVNLKHLYAADPCLDLAKPGIEPHGHGWPLANNITQWRWQCH